MCKYMKLLITTQSPRWGQGCATSPTKFYMRMKYAKDKLVLPVCSWSHDCGVMKQKKGKGWGEKTFSQFRIIFIALNTVLTPTLTMSQYKNFCYKT